MIAHTVVYVILSLLSATAVHAMGNPMGKSPQEHLQPGQEEQGSTNSL